MIRFALGIHNHQPVGNFDSVFREATEKAYRPFLAALSRHPGVRVSIHNSGILYEWFEQHERGILDLLGSLVERGQVELLTGGFYEPILPAIPERDAIGQIRLLSSFLEERFHSYPVGLWTAERVWEPHLPRVLARAGVRYTLLDDYHFRAAGLSDKELGGYYLTEDQGESIAVFPISKSLRYIIPFKQVEEAISFLRNEGEANGKNLVVFADDGEKFGIWPGTYSWVIEEGWLENFFTAIEENSSWLTSVTLGEALESTAPAGTVYLPSASYHEMMEWALFDGARIAFHEMEEELKARGLFDRLSEYAFFRGGFWRNFLAKYPEANALHKKMMRVSGKVEEASRRAKTAKDRSRLEEARRKLWAGQCNCPYWHGVFGGLYLPHLRAANYGSLIHAENLIEDFHDRPGVPRIESVDFDQDGREEIIAESRDLSLYIAPSLGAGVVELDYRPLCMNLMDLVRRKVEPYHLMAGSHGGGDEGGKEGIPSIHDISRGVPVRPSDMPVDPRRKVSFIDHFLPPALSLEEFARNAFRECGDFAYETYRTRTSTSGGTLTVSSEREGHLETAAGRIPLTLRKTYALEGNAPILSVRTVFEGLLPHALPLLYGVEFSVGEIAGDADDRHMTISPDEVVKRLGEKGAYEAVSGIRVVDGWRGLVLEISFSPHVALWHFPVETVSQSEGGVELIYQGTTFLAMMPMGGKGGAGRGLEVRMRFEGGKTQ
jgi:alpha-amylase